ncbi:MAG: division/cell wall cluster transcriptional repressor MraZ [Ruminococcus sp.]
MFSGMSNHNIDAKGRIVLPAKFREELGETFIIANGFNSKCVQVMSKEEYESLSARIMELPAQQAMAMQYIFNVTAVEVTPNAQGRIVIPPALRKRAKLDSEALVLGMNRRIEIWSSEVYEEFLQSQIDIAAGAMLNFRL